MAATRQSEGRRRPLLEKRSSRASFAAFCAALLCVGATLFGLSWLALGGAARQGADYYRAVGDAPALSSDGVPNPEAVLLRGSTLQGRWFARADGLDQERSADALGAPSRAKSASREGWASGACIAPLQVALGKHVRIAERLLGTAPRATSLGHAPMAARTVVSTRGSRAPPV